VCKFARELDDDFALWVRRYSPPHNTQSQNQLVMLSAIQRAVQGTGDGPSKTVEMQSSVFVCTTNDEEVFIQLDGSLQLKTSYHYANSERDNHPYPSL
jgi:hypothetical protein